MPAAPGRRAGRLRSRSQPTPSRSGSAASRQCPGARTSPRPRECPGARGGRRLEGRLEAPEDLLLARLDLLVLLSDRRFEPLEPPLDHLEVGQDQLGLEIHDVATELILADLEVIERRLER